MLYSSSKKRAYWWIAIAISLKEKNLLAETLSKINERIFYIFYWVDFSKLADMLNQSLQQKLLQKLSPQQILLMKMLQLPIVQFEQRIKEEMEINPALEEGNEEGDFEEVSTDTTETDFTESEASDETSDEAEIIEEPSHEDDIDMTEYFDEDDEGIADYKLRDPSEFADPDNENKTIPVAVTRSFHDHLEEQIGLLTLSDKEYQIALHLIGSIEEDGYLRRNLESIEDDLAFSQNIATTKQEVRQVLDIVQQLDPPGVGAQTLSECLLIQLNRKENPTSATQIAKTILKEQFDLFAKKHYERLEKILRIDSETLKAALEEIINLNPRPGNSVSEGVTMEHYVIPDFILMNSSGELSIILNARNAPELRISNSFRDMMRDYKHVEKRSKDQQEALQFVKQKIDSARWFIDAIKQRQHTLLSTMNSILHLQYEYLLTGDETRLRPMILKDIAELTQLDISTISRVSNSKFVQTEFGTFPLKYFFSESITTDSGEEVSTREVKKILSDIILAEDKNNPVSDQELTDALRSKGYNIARRTVAKYREQFNIPIARMRKEM